MNVERHIERKQLTCFRLHMDPPKLTAQQKGAKAVNGKVVHYTKAEIEEVREMFCRRLAWHRPTIPYDGPLSTMVTWTWRWRECDLTPSGEKKPSIAGFDWIPCDTKPDCSNIIKLFEDTLSQSGFFVNDSRNANINVWKGWGDDPGITVNIDGLIPVRAKTT